MSVDLEPFYRHLRGGDFAAAGALLESMPGLEAGSALHRKLLADCRYRASDFTAALDMYLRLGDDFPGYVDHRYHLVDCCAHLGLGHLGATELARLAERSGLDASNRNQVLAEGWTTLGMDANVIGLDAGLSHPGQNRVTLTTMRARSLIRLHGFSAEALAEFREGYCSPGAWLTHAMPEERIATYWRGQPALPKHLRVVLRGGVGDCVQWMRYAPALESMGVRVEVSLLRGALCWHSADAAAAARALRDQGYAVDESLPPMWTDPYTLFAALFPVLGYAAGERYMRVLSSCSTPVARDVARARARGKPCVGLFWSASESPDPFACRSLKLQHLGSLLAREDVHWVIFQRGHQRAAWLADPRSADPARTTLVDEAATFEECIALAGDLDAMVCIDTGLAHAAAAMGRPCVLVVNAAAEWRWECGDTTGWYPSMSIVRAPELGAWDDAVARAWGVLQNRLALARG